MTCWTEKTNNSFEVKHSFLCWNVHTRGSRPTSTVRRIAIMFNIEEKLQQTITFSRKIVAYGANIYNTLDSITFIHAYIYT